MIFKAGDFVTVDEWISHKDNSWKGTLLQIMVGSGDLVRVFHHNGAWKGDVTTLDLKCVRLKHVSKEFVASVLLREFVYEQGETIHGQ